MYHVSAQGVDERMINVHYYYYLLTCITQNLARRRTASTGDTHVRTFRGATVAQVTNIISTGACYPQVEQVVVAIGTNDCTGNKPRDIAADYQKLLSAIKAHFPTADVAAAASLPRLSADVTYDTIAAVSRYGWPSGKALGW